MRITWNSSWVNPFESTWSIIEKIKYANAITSREFVREFGIKNSSGKLIKQRSGLLRINGINLDYLAQSTGTDFQKHTEYHFNKIIGMFTNQDISTFIKKEFTYCVDCLSMGYHSLLHQFIFIQKCPYHLSNLNNRCNSCGVTTFCDIHNHNSKGGFKCSCSNYYSEPKFRSFTEWQLNLQLIDCEVLNWVTMDSATFNRIKETYFYFPSLKNMYAPIQFLLDFGKGN